MRAADFLAPRDSNALEYWFFALNTPRTGLLVDWIERRRSGDRELRVSVHSEGRREVVHVPWTDPAMPLAGGRTHGEAAGIAWDLRLDLGTDRVAADVAFAGVTRMSDLMLTSAPLARATGTVSVDGMTEQVDALPTHVSHYWGRALAREWWWVNARQFDHPGYAVECSVLRTRLWGLPVSMPAGYLYLRTPQGASTVTMPPGRGRVSGTPEGFTIDFRRPRRSAVQLRCTGRDYGDLGDGIVNTAVGDLDIVIGGEVVASAKGSAMLERREPQT